MGWALTRHRGSQQHRGPLWVVGPLEKTLSWPQTSSPAPCHPAARPVARGLCRPGRAPRCRGPSGSCIPAPVPPCSPRLRAVCSPAQSLPAAAPILPFPGRLPLTPPGSWRALETSPCAPSCSVPPVHPSSIPLLLRITPKGTGTLNEHPVGLARVMPSPKSVPRTNFAASWHSSRRARLPQGCNTERGAEMQLPAPGGKTGAVHHGVGERGGEGLRRAL